MIRRRCDTTEAVKERIPNNSHRKQGDYVHHARQVESTPKFPVISTPSGSAHFSTEYLTMNPKNPPVNGSYIVSPNTRSKNHVYAEVPNSILLQSPYLTTTNNMHVHVSQSANMPLGLKAKDSVNAAGGSTPTKEEQGPTVDSSGTLCYRVSVIQFGSGLNTSPEKVAKDLESKNVPGGHSNFTDIAQITKQVRSVALSVPRITLNQTSSADTSRMWEEQKHLGVPTASTKTNPSAMASRSIETHTEPNGEQRSTLGEAHFQSKVQSFATMTTGAPDNSMRLSPGGSLTSSSTPGDSGGEEKEQKESPNGWKRPGYTNVPSQVRHGSSSGK